MTTYRKPGVYLEEGSLTGVGEIGVANAYGLFVGAAARGSVTDPTLIGSWSEFDALYGGWAPVTGAKTNYMPYAVWSFYQNGGRNAWVQRAAAGSGGVAASVDVKDTTGGTAKTAFTVDAKSPGAWGGTVDSPGLSVAIDIVQSGGTTVFTLYVFKEQGPGFSSEVERFQNLSPDGTIPGTKRVDYAINDEVYGSRYIRISDVDSTIAPAQSFDTPLPLLGGTDGTVPAVSDLNTAATNALGSVEGPLIMNIAGYRTDADEFIGTSFDPSGLTRGDVFVVNDNYDRRPSGTSSEAYGLAITSDTSSSSSIGAYSGNSYVASYTPWIVVPDPAVNGGTIITPPGGAVAGMIARNDATSGVFQAPAGVQFGGINNALNVDAKFSDALLGSLNAANINVIRPVMGSGIAVMGGRTRKNYAADKYISARRTLIYLKETLKRSCEFALFRNNDEALWAALRSTASLILRPVWASGGLKGTNPNQAYQIVCDDTLNTPAVIASGEVRMEIGVALQTPAEFVVIRVSQLTGGDTSVTEV